LIISLQEESTSVSVTGKGGNQADMKLVWSKDDISRLDLSQLDTDKYSLKTRNTVTRMNMKRINLDLIVVSLF